MESAATPWQMRENRPKVFVQSDFACRVCYTDTEDFMAVNYSKKKKKIIFWKKLEVFIGFQFGVDCPKTSKCIISVVWGGWHSATRFEGNALL